MFIDEKIIRLEQREYSLQNRWKNARIYKV